MSYNSLTRFGQPLRIELHASRLLAAGGGLLHALAAAACLLAQLPLPVSVLLMALTATHYGYFLRRQAGAHAGRAVGALAWDDRRGWRVCCASDGWQAARLRIPVFVTASLVIVRFRLGSGRTCSVIVVADRLPADAFRRLRVRLLQSLAADRD
jgi:hypothetical protein